jgi:uncharacterized protein (TIGR02996 family)
VPASAEDNVSDRAALFTNVLERPSDDTARLVLADWLQENGEESLGRFLRAGVVASRFSGEEFIDSPDYYAALEELSAVARSGEPARWVAALGLGPDPLTNRDWSWDCAGDRVTVRVGNSAGVFARGLLSELEVTLGEWYEVAQKALATWPLERVRASDVPGLTFLIEKVGIGWRLTGRVRLPRRNVPLTGLSLPSAIAAGVVLSESRAEWSADQFFVTRAALVAGIAAESAAIVDDLKDAAGDRWPRPRRRRVP